MEWAACALYGSSQLDSLSLEQGWQALVVGTVIEVASVAATCFAHPLGRVISALRDVAVTCREFQQQLESGDCKAMVDSGLKVTNSNLAISALVVGGPTLMLASLCLQSIRGIYHAAQAYQEEDCAQMVCHCLLTALQLSALVECTRVFIDNSPKIVQDRADSSVVDKAEPKERLNPVYTGRYEASLIWRSMEVGIGVVCSMFGMV